MSQSIREIFFHAMLARAAYANISPDDGQEFIKSQLMSGQSAMSEDMADYFMQHFELIASSIGSIDGYDGLVFREVGTNHYILANRGTEASTATFEAGGSMAMDLLQDIILAVSGTNTQQFSMYKFISDAVPLDGYVTATGHSLGGFLTSWAQVSRPDLFLESYTFNGAGIANVLGAGTILNNIYHSLYGADLSFNSSIPLTHVRTAEGADVTSSAGFYFGSAPINVGTDLGASDGVGGHSIINLTDALLVAYVLNTLDESMTLNRASAIAESMSSMPFEDRNRVIAYLGNLLSIPNADALRTGNFEEALQEVAFSILIMTEAGGAQDINASIVSVLEESTSTLALMASEDNPDGALIRHALLNGSAFFLKGVTSSQTIPQGIQEVWSSDKYSTKSFNDQVSQAYVQEHPEYNIWSVLAEMGQISAYANMAANEDDAENQKTQFAGNNHYISDWNKQRDNASFEVGTGKNYRYIGSLQKDTFSGEQGNDWLYGLDGDDVLKGGDGLDYLEGGKGEDKLEGGSGVDVLMGGDDADTLTGGTGNDLIYGGKGIDTYVWNKGDGIDIITETDEVENTDGGRLKLNGSVISTVKYDEEKNMYKGSGFYFLYDPFWGLTVYDEKMNAVVKVKGFNKESNNLGIAFEFGDGGSGGGGGGGAPAPTPPTPAPRPIDPLVIDLDGDGLETVGLSAGILFDHGNDGVAENSGWVGEDDALLVRDINGDGAINNGSELFGNFTQLKSGQPATNGYTALADLDSNGDGFITADDTVLVSQTISEDVNSDGEITPDEITTELVPQSVFTQLRLWRDRNQNGQTDAGELLTLEQAGLVALSTSANYKSITQSDGNIQRGTSFAVTQDGHQVSTGIYDFEASPILREFTDSIDIPVELQGLPSMAGMGSVRDLREAAALSPELASVLTQFAAGDYSAQHAMLDELVLAWADSSEMVLTNQGSRDHLIIERVWVSHSGEDLAAGAPTATMTLSSGEQITAPIYWLDESYTEEELLLQKQLRVIEYFSGQSVRDWRNDSKTIVSATGLPDGVTVPEGGVTVVTVQLSEAGRRTVQDYWSELSHAVYQSLVQQTRLSEYIQQVSWNVGESGELQVDFTALSATLDDLFHNNFNADSLADVIELFRFQGDLWRRMGWDGESVVRQWVEAVIAGEGDFSDEGNVPDLAAMLSRLQGLGVHGEGLLDSTAEDYLLVGSAANDVLTGAAYADQLMGGAGNDSLSGAAGDDLLLGELGNDTLSGDLGDDTLVGGKGDDSLHGGSGIDTYEYSRGDGNDIIYAANDLQALSVLEFQGDITPDEVTLRRENSDLLVKLSDGSIIRVDDYFFGKGISISFRSDLTNWDLETIKTAVQAPTDGDDILYGYAERDDFLSGDAGNDTLFGLAGDDVLSGAAGDDHLQGEYGDDLIYGDEGDDVLLGGQGNDSLSGGAGNDGLWGDDGNDYFEAGDGDDQLDGGDGDDQLYADVGNDRVNGGAGSDLISGGDGNDVLSGDAGNDVVLGNDGDDVLFGGGGRNTLDGGLGDDTLYISGTDTVVYRLGDGHDVIEDGIDKDAYELWVLDAIFDLLEMWREGNEAIRLRFAGTSGGVTIHGLESSTVTETVSFADGLTMNLADLASLVQVSDQADSLHFIGGINDVLQLHGGDDVAIGSEYDDAVNGNDGNDTIHGGAGNDRLQGGDGNDILYGEDGDDVISADAGVDLIYGGDGNDEISGDSDDIAWGGNGDDQITGISEAYGESGDDILIAGQEDSYLVGGEGDDALYGGAGNDQLEAGEGNDSVFGGSGNDSIFGGSGNDELSGDSGDDIIDGGDGNDHVNGGAGADSILGQQGNDVIEGAEGDDSVLGGEGDDVLYGGAGDDVLYGEDGDDQLNGDDGNDLLNGGAGNDFYYVDIGETTTISDIDNSGYLYVPYYTLSSGLAPFDLFFRDSGGQAWGYSEDDLTHFYKDVDVVYDIASKEMSILGLDEETRLVISGVQPDQPLSYLDYTIDFNGFIINLYDGSIVRDMVFSLSDLISLSSVAIVGTDAADVIYSVSSSGVDDLPANNVYAGAGSDTVYGGVGDDYIRGEAGDDSLTGYDGDDVLDGGDGGDTLQGLNGNDRLEAGAGVDYLYGGSGDDGLYGGDGDDFLYGENGDDYLDGEDGSNTLRGGAGNDTYVVRTLNDNVAEGSNAGFSDRVLSDITYTLTGNVEQLVLRGDQSIDGTGNNLSNYIWGNSANNVLSGLGGFDVIYGGAGDDTLIGGAGSGYLYGQDGNDTLIGDVSSDYLDGGSGNDYLAGGRNDDHYVVDSAGDVVDELEYEGDDYVSSSISYTLTQNVESLELTDNYSETGFAESLIGTGNELDNSIYGNAGDNQLLGLDGYDYLNGGGGNDILIGGEGSDTLYGGLPDIYVVTNDAEQTAELISITSDNDLLDGGAGDDYLDGETGDDTLLGGEGNDALYGGDDFEPSYFMGGEIEYEITNPPELSNNDYLDGGEGDDYLDGGSGNDVLIGGIGADSLYGRSGDDILDGRDGDVTDYLEGGDGDDVYYIDGVAGTASLSTITEGDIDAGYLCGIDVVSRPGVTGGESDVVIEEAGGGYDIVYSTTLIAKPNNVEELHILGGDDLPGVTIGTIDDDVLLGGAGDDIIDGDIGADEMIGAEGNDIYVVDDINDVTSENSDEGLDAVYSLVDGYQLAANVEALYLGTFDGLGVDSTAGGVYSGYGNDGDNRIRGNVYDNYIEAGAGNDLLFGGGGFDVLDGGAGDDTYVVQTAYQSSYAGITDSSGNDRVHFAGDVSYSDLYITFYTDGLWIDLNTDAGNWHEVAALGWSTSNTVIDYLTFCNDPTTYSLIDIASGAPLAADDFASVSRTQFSVNGNVLDNDTAPSGASLEVVYTGEYWGSWGILNIASDGSYTYSLYDNGMQLPSLPAGEVVTDEFWMEVDSPDDGATDGPVVTAGSLLKITISDDQNNDPLVAEADEQVIAENEETVSGNVLDNDWSQTGNPFGVSSEGVVQGQYGVLTLGADGGYVYQQDSDQDALAAGEVLTEVFDYTISDGVESSSSTLTITIVGENDAPVAQDDTVVLAVDDGNVTGNVLVNDNDVDHGAELQAIAGIQQGQHGVLALSADGTYHYALDAADPALAALAEGEEISDTFTYEVTDGDLSSTAEVSVTIVGRNDAPVAIGDAAAIEEEQPSVSGNVLSNDSDIDNGSVLTITSAGSFEGLYGVLNLAADGSWTYALNNSTQSVQSLKEGETVSDVFAYQVSDGALQALSALAVTVTGRNDAPTVSGEVVSLTEDTLSFLSGNTLTNDHDIDGDSLVAGSVATQGQYGVFVLAVDGSWTYQPNTASLQSLSAGQVVEESFTYGVSDGAAAADGQITFVIEGRNDAPVAQADSNAITVGGAAISGNVLLNDSDVDQGTTLQAITTQVVGLYGILNIAADGSYQYQLNADQSALLPLNAGESLTESFAYNVTDGVAPVAGALSIVIQGRNDAPVLTADQAALTEDTASISGTVLTNDQDPDHGDSLAVTAASLQGQYGTLQLQANGQYDYVLNTGLVQSLAQGESLQETFVYQANDGQLASSSELGITITGLNDAPVVQDDVASTQVGNTALTGNVLLNDADVDQGTVLQVTPAQLLGQYGNLSLQADGSYQYVLNSNSPALVALADGVVLTESFAYTATDGLAAVSGNLTINVAGRNDAPVLTADQVTLTEDTASVQGSLLANDSDPDTGDVLATVTATQQGQYGVLSLDNAGHYSYQLNTSNVQSLAAGQSRTETFHYQATDGHAVSDSTLQVVITGVNDAPVTQADSATITVGTTSIAGNVLTNDSDVDQGTVLQTTAATYQGQYGSLSLAANGSYLYTLNSNSSSLVVLAAGETLTESFNYTATDGMASVPNNLQVTIVGRNDAPQAVNDSATMTEDTLTVQGNLLANDSDPDHGAQLQVLSPGSIQGSYGVLQLSANGSYSYQANNSILQSLALGESVVESFTHQISDGTTASSATLVITITGTNDAPVVVQTIANQTKNAGEVFSLTVPSNTFTDVDHADVLQYSATLSNGQALPSWLSFNAATGTLSGTATVAGSYQLKITATDKAGASASTDFALTINATTTGSNINGTECDDTLTGTSGNDVIDGKGGNDVMTGLNGDDIYYVDTAAKGNEGVGNGEDPPPPGHDDNYNDGSGTSPGNPGSQNGNGAGGNGNGSNKVKADVVVEALNGGYDTVKSTVSYVLASNVEALELLGTGKINGTGNSLANWLLGNSANNELMGGDGNDHLSGAGGADTLAGDAGVDLLQGGLGNDALTDTSGNGLLDGGAGTDTLSGNSQNQLFIGGTGNDTITLGGGNDVIAFNRGDGKDRISDVASCGGSLTVSLGQGIGYSDLTLSRSGTDLILNTGNSESITFAGWYKSGANRPTVTLQVVAESMSGFSQTSSNTMLDDCVETFQLGSVISAYTSANCPSSWSITNALSQFKLTGSDTSALGGSLAYQYGMTGSIAGIGAVSAQTELSASTFGSQMQTLKPLSGLSEGMSKLV